jgi:S-methylmethionine-dependent homocysteine/selenocysteine methylase
MNDPVFSTGQTVIASAIGPYGNHLTKGKEYTIKYEPRDVGPTFTFPAYAWVMGDMGVDVCCHAYRFTAKEIAQ